MSHPNHITRPDGTRIAYSVTGLPQGTPLVLSNSLATDARMWEKVLPDLQAKFRVITYDTRGHGESVCNAGNPSLSDLAHDLLAVLDAAGVAKAWLAGVSLGGMTLVAHRTPGHTKGNTTWTMRVTDLGKAYEVVIVGSWNVNPGYRLVNNAAYPGIAEDYERTFRTLKALKCDIFLGAHGSYFEMEKKVARLAAGGPNPFIDPAGYARAVNEREQAFRAELARQKAAVTALLQGSFPHVRAVIDAPAQMGKELERLRAVGRLEDGVAFPTEDIAGQGAIDLVVVHEEDR